MSRGIIENIIFDLESKGLNWPNPAQSKITKDSLIECWSTYSDIPDWKYFNYSSASKLSRIYNKIFKNIDLNKKGKSESFKSFILNKYEYKYCKNCKVLLSISNFSKNNERKTKLCSQCKDCQKEYYKSNIEYKKEFSKNYRLENLDKYKNYQANRRAALLNRTPSWANLIKIAEVYDNCPKGYHVDHIVPLQGNTVSGLHVENNLQYLTAQENLIKSNKW